jgi:hypothetical protein
MPHLRHAAATPEARSGLPAWGEAELPEPPRPHGLQWLGVVGPGVIVLGASIGSGEFLLGPAVFVRHGLSLLWVTGVAILLQTVFNTELMRYTLATGEPAFTGFMRTRPSSTLWATVYSLLYILQVGWPAWAATAAGAIFFLFTGRLAAAADRDIVFLIGVATFLLCVAILLVGRRIEHTLEMLNWALVVTTLTGFMLLGVVFVPASTWFGALAGFAGIDAASGRFDLLPAGADFFLLAGLVAYSGCGGVVNITLTNWARDKGYGMGQRVGFIPAAVGGEQVHLAHVGFVFRPDAAAMRRWDGWWRVVRADQWGVFFTGALFGMALPAVLYVTFIPRGSEIRDLGIAAALASGAAARAGYVAGLVIAVLGAWILFKTQIDNLEAMVRSITDIIWTGSGPARRLVGGDVRVVYYTVLGVAVGWGITALRLAGPIFLLQFGANVAGLVLVVAPLHLLYVNTRLLPPALRPPSWRRATLVATSAFYAFFLLLAVSAFL